VTILEMLAMLSGALFTGGAVYVSLVEQPARMRLSPNAAAEQFRFSYRRAAPWQATTAIICALSGVLASVDGASWTWSVGGALIGLAVPFTLIVVLPTNKRLLSQGGANDDERRELMRRWARLHWVRSALGTMGLIVLIRAALDAG
jgi:anthrone oxygenase-like protein